MATLNLNDMTDFEQAVDQVILDSERLHDIVNGGVDDVVIAEDGSELPTVRKALYDNLYFKTPPLPWVTGTVATVFNQLYAYSDTNGVRWYYAPSATNTNPVRLPTNPENNINWRLFMDSVSIAQIYAPINSPIFTGNPQVPTPSVGDNSKSIPTTEFVNTAVTSAIGSIISGDTPFTKLTVSGATSLNTLTVSGATTFNNGATITGTLDASTGTGRFRYLTLTQQDSTLICEYTDTNNPTWTKTALSPYTFSTHTLNSDVFINGSVSADASFIALYGKGNNQMDFLTILGNSSRPTTDPRLKVSGWTEVQNLRVTGTVDGISVGVDGLDIRPNSVAATANISVGTTLNVNGNTTLNNLTALDITATSIKVSGIGEFDTGITTGASGTLQVGGSSTFTGLTYFNNGFTVQAGPVLINPDLTVSGVSNLNGGISITGGAITSDNNMTVSGDVTLNGGTGTTTVNNLVVNGTVTGINFDLTGQSINVESLNSSGPIVAQGGLSVTGTATLNEFIASTMYMIAENATSSTTTWSPSGDANFYNLTLTQNITLGAWPNLSDLADNNQAFSAMIYVTQDATGGHSITLDSSYVILNTDVSIGINPNDVSILQLTYCGTGNIVDVVIVRRP